jgi:L-threonylcarbamoyladenylate synthase
MGAAAGVTEVFEVDPARPDEHALAAAAEALGAGQVVVFPTETVYGIACRPDLHHATEQLFMAKARPPWLNLPVLAATKAEAWTVAEPTSGASALAAAFWPGGLTMVLSRTGTSKDWRLGEQPDTIAVRVPNHAIALGVLRIAGPLAVTSANISGQPPASTRDGLLAAFSDTAHVILVLAGGAPLPGGIASTVVDATGDEVRVLRAGAVGEAAIRAALGEEGTRQGQ